MVKAFLPAYLPITLAARPVGASKTVFKFLAFLAFTSDAIRVVFPVPAYPFKTKANAPALENSSNFKMASFWLSVTSNGKCLFISV